MFRPELNDRLTGLLGRTWRHQGQCWRIIDLLPEAGLLVLESADGLPAIQLDQFGRASYRANELCQIPLFDPGGGLSNDLQSLLGDLGLPAEDLSAAAPQVISQAGPPPERDPG